MQHICIHIHFLFYFCFIILLFSLLIYLLLLFLLFFFDVVAVVVVVVVYIMRISISWKRRPDVACFHYQLAWTHDFFFKSTTGMSECQVINYITTQNDEYIYSSFACVV